ncbi:MAG: putative porin [Opitutaceae bacterium]|nr:putative porin [Opitutaceae bacterium]
MFKAKLKLLATAVFLCGAGLAMAQDSGPLIDILVRKGLISDQEAEDLRAELIKDFAANTSAGKLNVGSHLTEFKLGGDVRLRHQVETQAPQNGTVSNERTRERFRFRFNGDFLMQKGWGAGFAFETAPAADSGNQTFENGNNDYSLYLARAYVSWRPSMNLLLTGGKQKNPFFTTDMIWDADINPQGATEIYTHYLGSKDTLEFRAGQILMDDNTESAGGRAGRDAWLFAQQAVYTKWFGKDAIGNVVNSFILAPGFMVYNDSTLSGLDNETPFNGTTDGLAVFTLPGEVNWMNVVGAGTGLKLYWDFAYNLEAERRVRRVYGLAGQPKDATAWLVGLGYAYGAGKVQGDYSLKLDYRSVGTGSVDVNLSDSDWAFGRVNQEGFKLAGTYNLTDFANLAVTYFYTTDKRETQTSAVGNLDHSQILQVDLVVKF